MSPTQSSIDPGAARISPIYSDECREVVARWQGIETRPLGERRSYGDAIPIFRNRLMEVALTKAPPILPWLWSVPIMVFGAWWGTRHGLGPAALAGLFAIGLVLWTLIEYVLHRFLFHFTPSWEPARMFFFLMHGYHHEFPDDRMRLVAPPLMFTVLATFFAVTYRLAFGAQLWAPLFAGTTAGYLIYDCIHYYAHHARPGSPVGRFLRNYHLRHHFESADTRYGISSPLWDFIFGTFRGLGKP